MNEVIKKTRASGHSEAASATLLDPILSNVVLNSTEKQNVFKTVTVGTEENMVFLELKLSQKLNYFSH